MSGYVKLGKRQLFVLQWLQAEGGTIADSQLYASDRDVMLTLDRHGLAGFIPENELQAYWSITDAGRAALADGQGDGE